MNLFTSSCSFQTAYQSLAIVRWNNGSYATVERSLAPARQHALCKPVSLGRWLGCKWLGCKRNCFSNESDDKLLLVIDLSPWPLVVSLGLSGEQTDNPQNFEAHGLVGNQADADCRSPQSVWLPAAAGGACSRWQTRMQHSCEIRRDMGRALVLNSGSHKNL